VSNVKHHILTSVLFVFGIGVFSILIQLFLKGVTDSPTPFGEVQSTDPVLSGPYGGGQDRFTANELHALNKHVEKLLTVLEELKGRIGG
jgi:hypothetical protein